MKPKSLLPLLSLAAAALLAAPLQAEAQARNKDGSIVTGVLTARFNSDLGLDGLPIPNNLLFLGTTDLTVNVDTEGLDGTAAALVGQLNTLDGFSTTERWVVPFVDDGGNPGSFDPASVVPGQSVRVFQVETTGIVVVTRIVRELQPGVEYTAVPAPGGILAIVPLQPLDELTSYMAVLTNDIRDSQGNDATPDQQYFLTKREEPWVDENGNSTYPLIDDATAQALAAVQPITASMEGAAARDAGIDPDDIILSWTVQTQSITPTLGLLRSIAQPAPVLTVNTGLDTSVFGGPGAADIYIGIITLPYYLGVPSAENPTAPLTEFWQAEPGAYIPPFDQLGLDPTSTNITVANPFPALTDLQTVPLLITVPNENSGFNKPPGGWPVVIFGHGLGRNRMDLLAAADGFAAAGFVAIAMDFPLHGVLPQDPLLAPFYIGNTPLGAVANERHFDLDVANNETGEPGPDGLVDPSGAYALNFQEFRNSRDNVRQGIIDLSVLALSVQNVDLDSDLLPDLQPFDLAYAGQSWGGINGTGFSALEPLVTRTVLNVPAGGLVRAGEASPVFGPPIRAGLESVGIIPGDPLFELFLTVGQTVSDSADPINWIGAAALRKPVLLHEVIGDQVLPNFVPGAPLAGTEPMIRVGGLTAFNETQVDLDGLRVAGRFVPPASHGSWLSPATSIAATIEMQTQIVNFIASDGTFVPVDNPATMLQPVNPASEKVVKSRIKSIGQPGQNPVGGGGASSRKDGGTASDLPAIAAPITGGSGTGKTTGYSSGVATPILGDRHHD